MRRQALTALALVTVGAGLTAAFIAAPFPRGGGGLSCQARAKPLAQLALVFGTQRKDTAPVSRKEWEDFLAAEVAPRFPGGLTALTGYGLWRGPGGVSAGETSHLLLIWYEPAEGMDERIEAIRVAYKARFGQESVLRADTAACVSF
ncbi:MAG TPA: DUF3574 domain-containing protein [Methylocella sp.]|nr:DUF3574 domain-containing protein [Methylocella sp.]